MGQDVEAAANLKRLTLKALQEKCKAQSLNAVGTKAQLIERLCEEIRKEKDDVDKKEEEADENEEKVEEKEDKVEEEKKEKSEGEKEEKKENEKEEKVEEEEEERKEKEEEEKKEEKVEEKEEATKEATKEVEEQEENKEEDREKPDVEMAEATEDVDMGAKVEEAEKKADVEMEEKRKEEEQEKESDQDAEDADDGKIVVDLEPSDDEDMGAGADVAATGEYKDCAEDTRARVKERCTLHEADSTLDSFLGPARSSMTSLCCEGFQYLFCRSRTNYGLCGGIYCYEVRWLEKSRSSGTVRFGFSKKKYSGFLNDADSIGFTSEGGVLGAGDGVMGAKFDKGDTLAVIADFKKPQTACISLFVNGERACPKIDLPDGLKQCLINKEGLFPTFCSKNAAFSMNLSSLMWSNIDFKVRMIGDAAEDDTVPNPIDISENPEVIFPMMLPEQDKSYRAPEGYLTVSDAFLLDWIEKSENVASPKGFNVKTLDEREPLLAMLRHLTVSRRQNVVIYSDNLIDSSRKELLKMFAGFRKRAIIDLQIPEDEGAATSGSNFTKFTLPSKNEGFDEIVFSETEAEDRELLTKYIENRKLTERLQPTASQEFRHKWENFTKDILIWMKQRRGLDMTGIEEKEYTDDVLTINVFNGGVNGKPIFAFFSEEDWLILQIRFQYALMVHWFCQQYDRVGFHIKHFEYYYQRYFSKATKPQDFDKETVEEVILAYVPELEISKNMVSLREGVDLEPLAILRQVEIQRRDRAFRVEAGDEMAAVSFESLKENKKANVAATDGDKRRDLSRSRGADRRRRHSRSRSRRSRSARRRREDRRESDRRNPLSGGRR